MASSQLRARDLETRAWVELLMSKRPSETPAAAPDGRQSFRALSLGVSELGQKLCEVIAACTSRQQAILSTASDWSASRPQPYTSTSSQLAAILWSLQSLSVEYMAGRGREATLPAWMQAAQGKHKRPFERFLSGSYPCFWGVCSALAI